MKFYPTQYVCEHRIKVAFENIIGKIGFIHKVACEDDNKCLRTRMRQYLCAKCNTHMEKENRIEMFAYNVWNLCDKCEKSFYDMVENFFQPECSKREDL